MSTPLTSPAPDAPSGSSNPVSLKSWFTKITTWIADMSPSGAGSYESGWQNITPAAGFTATGAQVQRIGKILYFKGYISGGALSTAGTVIGTAPSGYIPSGGVDGSSSGVGLGNGSLARATISGTGAITVIPPANATTAVYLKGLSGCTVA